MSDDDMVRQLAARLHELYLGGTLRQAETIAIPLVNEGWSLPPTRMWSLEASQRADQDAAELEQHLRRTAADGLVAPGTQLRTIAEQLVTWGWTRIGPGERVVCQPTPRNEELDLRDELAATIAGVAAAGGERPLALADYLVRDGWVKLGPNEKVVTPMSADDATQIVAAAFQEWETLKSESQKRLESPVRCPVCNEGYDSLVTMPGKKAQFVHHISLDGKDCETHEAWWPQGPAVSADSSELTATVKLHPESLILAAFAGAGRPLTRAEACNSAAGRTLSIEDNDWDLWFNAFGSLVLKDWVREQYTRLGEIRRYVCTEAAVTGFLPPGEAW